MLLSAEPFNKTYETRILLDSVSVYVETGD